MDIRVILVFVFFTILVSIQYSLNRILLELRDIRKHLYKNQGKIDMSKD